MNAHQRRKGLRLIARLPNCGYHHGGTIECRGDGYMWDADCDGYDPDGHSAPCPSCNTREWLLSAKDEAEVTCTYSSMTSSGTGLTIWEGAVKIAEREQPLLTRKILKGIGKVVALDDEIEVVFTY